MKATAPSACWVLLSIVAPLKAALPQTAPTSTPGYNVAVNRITVKLRGANAG